MKTNFLALFRSWRNIGLVISLFWAFLPVRSGPSLEADNPGQPAGLARIDLNSEAELRSLGGQGIDYYTTLYTAGGNIILLVPVEQNQPGRLDSLGYTAQVLDADPQGDSYYLLYGTPQALRQAAELALILLVEGRQGVARVTPGQVSQLEELGLQTLPLYPHPLAVPLIQEQSPLRTISMPNPLIQEMVAQVDTNDLRTHVGDLSGEWPVVINGSPYTIATRYTRTGVPITRATRHAYEFFQSIGLPVIYDDYLLSGSEKRNVIAEQAGVTEPQRILLLTAHLDSYSGSSSYSLAPGADDNASGSAGLMAIAEILSQYDFACTLRYALFTGEEQGLVGSRAYAAEVYNLGEDVGGVLNLDMIAYNTPQTARTIWLHTRPSNPGDLAIANLFENVVSAYQIKLLPLIQQDGQGFSDHAAFWERGYPALLAIEDWSDHTPFYHQTGDQLESLDMAYYTEFVKAALATFAHMGCLLDGELSGTVRNASNNAPIPWATVEAWTNNVFTSTTTTQADGSYHMTLNPASYTMQVSAMDFLGASASDVQILYGQTTVQDFVLTPCVWVKEVVIKFSPGFPEVGQTVTFSGSAGGGQSPISYSWDFGDGSSGNGADVSHSYTSVGTYAVKLTANNPCGVTATDYSTVFVDVNRVHLPLVPTGH